MAYTVKGLADLAGVSVRTLHYYDELGLLKPTYVGRNGYRYYERQAVLRLQQILFYREMGLSLTEIREILDDPGYNLVGALEAHRANLMARMRRLERLVETIDSTLVELMGEMEMENKKLFAGFTAEEEEGYVAQAREQYGDVEVDASYQRWNSYSESEQAAIKAEGRAIYAELAALVGSDPASEDVQALIGRWHEHLRSFYEPSIERLRGLGQLYCENPDFRRNFSQLHPDLPEFLRAAIEIYCERLEK
jgi:DNA-binding transcriptional MerR regulator